MPSPAGRAVAELPSPRQPEQRPRAAPWPVWEECEVRVPAVMAECGLRKPAAGLHGFLSRPATRPLKLGCREPLPAGEKHGERGLACARRS